MNSKILANILASLVLMLMITSLSSAQLVVKNINSYPNEIAPGETSRISVLIENIGDEDFTNIVVKLNLNDVPFVPKDSSTEKVIDELKDEEDDRVSFIIQALNDAESGTYKIPVKIIYNDSEKIVERNEILSLTINSKPEIVLEIVEGLFIKDQINEVEIKIINKGLSDIKFLEVETKDIPNVNVLSPEYLYIGGINSDDFDTVKFDVMFKKGAPKTVNFILDLTYKDITNKEYTEQHTARITVYSKDEAYNLGLLKRNYTIAYIGIAVALIIIWIIYRKIRKTRRLRKAEERRNSGRS